jgi:hypothetical protein
MSLRCEQRRALLNSREFFLLLMLAGKRWTKTELRHNAARCLKHFPPLHDNGEPIWSQDEDKTDQ